MSKQDIVDYVTNTPHNINPAILNQKLDEMEVQPDWNANEGEPGHVLNRTHYEIPGVDIFDEDITLRTSSHENRDCFYVFTSELPIELDKQYRLTYDCGTKSTSVTFTGFEDGFCFINPDNYNNESDSYAQGMISKDHISLDYPESHNGRLTITRLGEIKTLDPKYLPDNVFIIDTTADDYNTKDTAYGDKVKKAILSGKTVYYFDGSHYGTIGSFFIASSTTGTHHLNLQISTLNFMLGNTTCTQVTLLISGV